MERRQNSIIILFLLLFAFFQQRANTVFAQTSYPSIDWSQCFVLGKMELGDELHFWSAPTSFYDTFTYGPRGYFDARVTRDWRVYTTRSDVVGVYWDTWRFLGNVVYPSATIINVGGVNYRTFSPQDGWAEHAHGYWWAPRNTSETGDVYLCPDPPPLLYTPTPAPTSTPTPTASSTPTPTPTPTATSTPTPTPTPNPTNTPTNTPTGNGGGGGGGGGGDGGDGGGGSGTGTQVPEWCGLVPTHPCWVIWATQEADERRETQVALEEARQQTQIALLETVAARAAQPTETPYALPVRETAQSVAQSGPGAPVPYSQTSGTEVAEAYGYEFFRTTRYDFGCPITWQGWATICIRYVYVSDIQLYPSQYLPTYIFVGALVLIVLGFVVRR